jgi:hypothetical protein
VSFRRRLLYRSNEYPLTSIFETRGKSRALTGAHAGSCDRLRWRVPPQRPAAAVDGRVKISDLLLRAATNRCSSQPASRADRHWKTTRSLVKRTVLRTQCARRNPLRRHFDIPQCDQLDKRSTDLVRSSHSTDAGPWRYTHHRWSGRRLTDGSSILASERSCSAVFRIRHGHPMHARIAPMINLSIDAPPAALTRSTASTPRSRRPERLENRRAIEDSVRHDVWQ